jgi:MYXO-CTERM domain-containing protein
MKSPAYARAALLMMVASTAGAPSARADDILVYQKQVGIDADPTGGDIASAEAAAVLRALGHTVTLEASLTPVLPADLSVFDSIWVVQLAPLSDAAQLALGAFVEAGGGLYLTGERVCCNPLDESLSRFVSTYYRLPGANFGPQLVEGGMLQLPTAASPFGISTTPNAITEWHTFGAGLIIDVRADRVVFENEIPRPFAAAFPPEDLEHGSGCLFVAMDMSHWMPEVAPEQDLGPLMENIETFLVTCGDSDEDGVSDEGEEVHGMDPGDPDSDHDGLCDGHNSVEGVCIDGEHPDDDFEDDGRIAPLDPDDDDDTIPTAFELAAERQVPDADGDRIPAWLDLDSDGNFILDIEEGEGDYDGDGIPAIVDEGDEPAECDTDADCGEGQVCNAASGYCRVEVAPDGGTPGADASRVDAGAGSDAGSLDGGPALDGGRMIDAGVSVGSGGCGCSAVGAGAARTAGAALSGMALAIAGLVRRRREGRRGAAR